MIKIGADLTPITDFIESTEVLIEGLGSRRFLDATSGYAAELGSSTFNEFMDLRAENQPARLGHMYEWGQLGQDSGRLWRNIILGGGGTKTMYYDFLPSTEEVPAGEGETGIAGDTRRGGHVFIWKAPVVENGQQVEISPVNGRWLAIPTQDGVNNAGSRNRNLGGTMWFSQNSVRPPVNREAAGAFEAEWIQHFAGVTQVFVQEIISSRVEEFVEEYVQVTIGNNRVRMVRPGVVRLASERGEKIGQRKVGGFMKNIELDEQILRLERLAYGF